MTNGREYDKPAVYEIVVKGKLDSRWSRWFADLQIILQPDGNSLLTGPITDQSALFGVISITAQGWLKVSQVWPV